MSSFMSWSEFIESKKVVEEKKKDDHKHSEKCECKTKKCSCH